MNQFVCVLTKIELWRHTLCEDDSDRCHLLGNYNARVVKSSSTEPSLMPPPLSVDTSLNMRNRSASSYFNSYASSSCTWRLLTAKSLFVATSAMGRVGSI